MKESLMFEIIKRTWKLNRALVSEDFEKALDILGEYIKIDKVKIKSGTECFDWVVPNKWVIKDGWVKNSKGEKVIDWKEHPLHVVINSSGVNKNLSKKELLKHLSYSKDFPDAIPYKYFYYKESWGFCCTKKQYQSLKDEAYEVFIDAQMKPDYLTIGEHVIPGQSNKSLVLMAHLDHPGQVQDGLSGCALLVQLAKELQDLNPYYTIRILFLPERIGSIAYLAKKPEVRKNIIAGIFAEMISTPGKNLVLQHSRDENNLIDRVSKFVLSKKVKRFMESPCFEHVLNDDAFFNAPGIDIPCISLSRSDALTETNLLHHNYYHTSGDDLDLWDEKKALESLDVFKEIVTVISKDKVVERNYDGVPFLSKHGLWPENYLDILLIEKILNNLDNGQSIFNLSEKLNIPFEFVEEFINKLKEKGLVRLKPTVRLWA